MPLPDDVIAHRVGGADIMSLRLSAADLQAYPPGLSVLLGGTPHQAAAQMRAAFPGRKWQRLSVVVGSATAGAIRSAGFDVIQAGTNRLPNHGRIVHAGGVAEFTDANLARLAAAFTLTTGT